jgi:flagellin-like protein
MKVRALFQDENAVSPVIGVILMVAITVILAAVIGAFVLNIGGSQDTAPTASIQWKTQSDGDNTYLEFTVESSNEELQTSELRVQASGKTLELDTVGNWQDDDAPSSLMAGSSVFIYDTSDSDTSILLEESSYTDGSASDDLTSAEIVWHSTSSDKTSVLSSYSA